VIPQRVSVQDVLVEFTTAHQHDVAVVEDVTFPQPPQFHNRDYYCGALPTAPGGVQDRV
jgi:hypothetical protein